MKLMTYNQAYRDMVFSRHQIEVCEGMDLREMLPPERLAFWNSLLERVNKGEIVQQDMEEQREGELYYIGLKISPIWDGEEVIGCALILRDVTQRVRISQQLKKSEAYQRAILDSTSFGYYLLDQDGTLLAFNRYAQISLAGQLNSQHILGENILDRVQEEDRASMLGDIRTAWNGANVEGVYPQETPGGEIRWLSYRYTPYAEEDGKTTAVLLSVENVTRQYEDEQKLLVLNERFTLATESAQIGVWDWDFQTDTFGLDEQMYKLHGLEQGVDTPSRSFFEKVVLKEDIDQLIFEVRRAIAARDKVEFVVRIRVNDEIRYTRTRGKVYFDEEGTPLKLIGATWDITHAKRTEHSLIQAKKRAEEMTHLKSTFLANMSHEIRTPLNGILGLIGILSEETDLFIIREMLELVQKSGYRLLSTLTGILELSRIEAEHKSYDFEPINLGNLLMESVEALYPPALQKKLFLSFNPEQMDLMVNADRRILPLIIDNIIGNALKFTHEGGIDVRLTHYENGRKKYARILVKDTGIGIHSENLVRIFEPYVQESAGQQREYEGTGLGLSIAKRYTELLGGAIRAQSQKGEGSVFTIDLPLAEPMGDETDEA